MGEAGSSQQAGAGQDCGPVILVTPPRFADSRGWFSESFNERVDAERGIAVRFVQDNHSYSQHQFTLRGLHFQTEPHAQDKLVRCVRGRVWDVAVDVRRGSPTFARWAAAELTADGGEQIFIPTGFAHGFLTLEPDCEVIYKVSDFYDPASEAGLKWDDPDLAIDWPLPAGAAPMLSAKDEVLPQLNASHIAFAYDGRPLSPLPV